MFQVYTYFGRELANFPIGDALHHSAAERARKDCATRESQGTTCWVRYVPARGRG